MSHVDFNEFVVEKQPFAHGSFKKVYKGRWSKRQNKWVVMLVLRNSSHANLSDFQNEIQVFGKVGRHHNLAQLLATSTYSPSGDKCMVMEYAEQGSLDQEYANVMASTRKTYVQQLGMRLSKARATRQFSEVRAIEAELESVMTVQTFVSHFNVSGDD